MNQEAIRLNKYLSEKGICSRREADRLTEEGKVLVNGQKAVLGMKVLPEDEITVNGEPVTKEKSQRCLDCGQQTQGCGLHDSRIRDGTKHCGSCQYPQGSTPLAVWIKIPRGLF